MRSGKADLSHGNSWPKRDQITCGDVAWYLNKIADGCKSNEGKSGGVSLSKSQGYLGMKRCIADGQL